MSSVVMKMVSFATAVGMLFGGRGSGGETQATKVIRYQMAGDFKTLDPALALDRNSFDGMNQLFEGLVRQTAQGPVPGMAERWELLDGGTKYLFHLRDGLHWSNGEPLTAVDFAYSWTRALDPNVGSEYAYQLYYIKGAEAFNTVDPRDAARYNAAQQALGVKALDAQTLEVTLAAPAPVFLELTAFPTLFPVPQRVVEQNKDWAVRPESFVSNGPFKLEKREAGKSAVLVKNPEYWNASAVKVDKLLFMAVSDPVKALQLFEIGMVDLMGTPPGSAIPRLQKEQKLGLAPGLSTYYYVLNTSVKPMNDPRVRRALSLAIDRNALRSIVPSATPAHAFVPVGATDATPGSDFRTTGGDLFREDLAEAKRLLAEAGYPNGKGFPATELIYNNLASHTMITDAVVSMWQRNLGITSITPVSLTFKDLLDRRWQGNFQIARAGWIGDYRDASSFLDLFVTGSGNNDARYSNPAYDALIRQSRSTADQQTRQSALHQAESLLMRDMPVIPLYFYNEMFVQSPKVTGVYRDPLGVIDFTFADRKN